jgi:NTE family protein
MSAAGPVVALGGGGARAIAHLGVLAELEAAGLAPPAVAGTSAGALMGALWMTLGAAGSIDRVRKFVHSGLGMRIFDIGDMPHRGGPSGVLRRLRGGATLAALMWRRNILTSSEFKERVAFFLPDVTVESLPMPLVIVATDNATGEEVRLSTGPLRLAVAASSAMPGLVAPIAWGARRLQDGGAVAEVPVGAARTLGSPVVAVEVSEGLPVADPERDRLPRAMFRAAAMGWQELRRRLLAEADWVIAPQVNHLHWADYDALDVAVEAGRRSARDFLNTWRSQGCATPAGGAP